jgi:phosphotransferase system HPr-like phosphotransfer protein
MEFQVMLTSVSDVKDFVDATAVCPSDIDVHSGRYVVNGKSIMCLFSLDLSVPVKVHTHGDGAGEQAFREKVKKFIVE